MILSGNMGPDRSKTLVSCLLPRGDIAEDYVMRIIGSLSNKEMDAKVKVRMVANPVWHTYLRYTHIYIYTHIFRYYY
jgi:hypothetical protein